MRMSARNIGSEIIYMSQKSIAEKLLIKPRSTVWVSDSDHFHLIEPLPDHVRSVDGPEEATTALVFVNDAASARRLLDTHKAHLGDPSAFWVAYPKGNRSDINRDTLWPILAEYGMRPIGQVALNETWSALRFRTLNEGEPPFKGGASQRDST
jgi:hypothetical protein